MFSPDRLNHLTRLFLNDLVSGGVVQASAREAVHRKLRHVMDSINKQFGTAFESAEKVVQSTKKNLIPGSAEYVQHVDRVFFEHLHRESEGKGS